MQNLLKKAKLEDLANEADMLLLAWVERKLKEPQTEVDVSEEEKLYAKVEQRTIEYVNLLFS